MRKIQIETLPLEKLKSWELNPRSITDENYDILVSRIDEKGFFKPLIVDGRTLKDEHITVLGGNQRLRALRDLGYDQVVCSVVYPENDDEAIEYSLIDNDSSGYYDEEKLLALIDNKEIPIEDFTIPISQTKLINIVEKKEIDSEPKSQSSKEEAQRYQLVIDVMDSAEQDLIFNKLLDLGIQAKRVTY